MKCSGFTLLLALFAISCGEDQLPNNQFPQTWKIAGWRSSGFGGDSGFQVIIDSSYTYVFKKDGTFLKTVGLESSIGTYQIAGNRTQYELTFPDDKLVDSCFGNTETLSLAKNQMLVGGSAPCDGPSVFFKRETPFNTVSLN